MINDLCIKQQQIRLSEGLKQNGWWLTENQMTRRALFAHENTSRELAFFCFEMMQLMKKRDASIAHLRRHWESRVLRPCTLRCNVDRYGVCVVEGLIHDARPSWNAPMLRHSDALDCWDIEQRHLWEIQTKFMITSDVDETHFSMSSPRKNRATSWSVHCQGKPRARITVFSSILSSNELQIDQERRMRHLLSAHRPDALL